MKSPVLAVGQEAHLIFMLINFLTILYLIIRVLKFKVLTNEIKSLWILVFLFVSPIIIYYIWFVDDRLVKKQK